MRIINWADILSEAFTPDTMKRWGLDYKSVKLFKPDIIYYSTSQLGQTGPEAAMPGHGVAMGAYSGFYHMKDRNHFIMMKHPEMGLSAYDAHGFRLCRTPAKFNKPAPCLGEHNKFVYTNILGMSNEEFTDFSREGVFD